MFGRRSFHEAVKNQKVIKRGALALIGVITGGRTNLFSPWAIPDLHKSKAVLRIFSRMARKLRVQCPGPIYHAMNWG